MQPYSRKKFLQTSALAFAGAIGFQSFSYKKRQPKLAFSTLGCPDWSFGQITDFARSHGYTGLEIRGVQREIDLTKAKEFNSPEARKATLGMMKDKGLKFINLGSSSTLHFADPAVRTKQLDEGKRYIDLAAELNCPYIRVFPNNLPADQDKQKTLELIGSGLSELANYARGKKVKVLMETHGDLVHPEDILQVMQIAGTPDAGLVWDVTNMWIITHEAPAEVYPKLKKYIHHVHVKDARMVDGKPQYVFLGKGEVPILNAIDLLAKDNYAGYYSFEWEKLWHPEIAEPELAIADFSEVMKSHFK